MQQQLNPVYLFADSQPLFETSIKFLSNSTAQNASAAYIGFSNKNEPVFYEIFLAIMNNQGITNCMQISSNFSDTEKEFLENSNLILLAGGDTKLGWKILQETACDKILQKKYSEGSILIGVSAGAIQLGLGFMANNVKIEALQIIPMYIDVHDEQNNWNDLKLAVLKYTPALGGLGIPLHGGLVYHVDGTIQAIAKPIEEFRVVNGVLFHNLIIPE